MLDEQAAATYAMIDELAERALMIGGAPVGDPADYLPAATVKPSKGTLSLRKMLEEAAATLDVIIREMHADADTAAKADDIGTTDLYTRLVQVHQKNRWFLAEILRKKDGLTS
jgi:starvation-inducible DNA-binding protein